MVRKSRRSFQVGEPAYLGENRVRVLGRYRIVGSEQQQRVWVEDIDDHGHTVACDEADLQATDQWWFAQLKIRAAETSERSWKIRTESES